MTKGKKIDKSKIVTDRQTDRWTDRPTDERTKRGVESRARD